MPRYSQLYIDQGPRTSDSVRARRRVGARLRSFGPTVSSMDMAAQFAINVGSRIRENGYSWSDWDHTVQSCDPRDFLDMITEVFDYLRTSNNARTAQLWLQNTRVIFAEENLAYEIDDAGVVHPAIDAEFQRNRTSTLAALNDQRYANVRNAFERVSPELLAEPPNFKEAWRTTFAAVEGMFRLMFSQSPRLTAAEIDARLRPVVQTKYEADPIAQRTAAALTEGFKKWVDASHNYRHEHGAEEPAQPPMEVAILAISEGAAYLRWLADVDQERVAIGP